ncbi:MAG: hypothetical protein MJ227_04180 [Bacilli bacterium]|nr:hypothetical protein [Bacilli bacterium]
MILNKSCKFILLGALVVPFSAALISGAIDNTSKINAQPSFSPTYHKFELHDLTKTLNKDIFTHVCLDLSYPALGVNKQSSWLCDFVGSNFLKVNGSYLPQGSSIGVDASQGDSHFRFYLYENTIHYTANRYTVLTFSGTQQTYSGANFLVSPSQFIFDNVTKQFEVFEPEIEITTGEGIQLVDGIYYIEPGTNLSSFMASVTNNLDKKFGDVSISYTCENLINNKFVKNEKDVLTSSKITVKVDCNYEIFEFNYDLKIGYRDFEMLEGAAISYEGNLGDMLVGAEISNTVLNKFNNPTFGALFVKTQDLIDNNLELTPESVFLFKA